MIGFLSFMGDFLVTWSSQRQWSIVSSAYTNVFSAVHTTTEEAQSLRYILHHLRCNALSDTSCPTRIFGDNLYAILNTQNPAVELSKKHVVTSFHVVKEAVTAGLSAPYWLKEQWDISGWTTEQIPTSELKNYFDYFYQRPYFHLYSKIYWMSLPHMINLTIS